MSLAPAPAPRATESARHAPLDAWRGVAILAVFAYHAVLEFNVSPPADISALGRLGALPIAR